MLTITDYLGIDHTLTGQGVIDFKHPRFKPKEPEGLPYVFQVLIQMDCADADWGIIAFLPRGTLEWCIVVVLRHEPTILAIRKAVNQFWQHMETGTDYPPTTSKEASHLIRGNRLPERHDLRDGPTEEFMNDARQNLIAAVDQYTTARRAKDGNDQIMQDAALIIKSIMGGAEKVILPGDIKVAHSTVEHKAKPEKVVPATTASTSRRLRIDEGS